MLIKFQYCVSRRKRGVFISSPFVNDVTIIEMKSDNSHGFAHSTAGQVFNIQLFTQTIPTEYPTRLENFERAPIFDSINDNRGFDFIFSAFLATFTMSVFESTTMRWCTTMTIRIRLSALFTCQNAHTFNYYDYVKLGQQTTVKIQHSVSTKSFLRLRTVNVYSVILPNLDQFHVDMFPFKLLVYYINKYLHLTLWVIKRNFEMKYSASKSAYC